MDEQLTSEEREIHALFAEVPVPTTVQRYGVAAPPVREPRGFGRTQMLSALVAVCLVGALVVGFLGFHSMGRVGSGGGPPARADAAMAYDPDSRQVVLFGGFAVNPNAASSPTMNSLGIPNWVAVLGDTWLWDGTAWIQASPGHSPSPRAGAQMAWDPHSHRLILVGGAGLGSCNPTCGTHNDGWAWDGHDWSQISIGDLGKQPLVSFAGASVMATDERAGEIVLLTVDGSYAGSSASSSSSDAISGSGSVSPLCAGPSSAPATCAPQPDVPPVCSTSNGAQGTITSCGSCPSGGIGPSPASSTPPGGSCSTFTTPPMTTWAFDGTTFRRVAGGLAGGSISPAAGVFWSPSLGHVIATGLDEAVMTGPTPPSCNGFGCSLPIISWEWSGGAWQRLPGAASTSVSPGVPLGATGDPSQNDVVALDATGQTWLGSGSPGAWVKAQVARSPSGRTAQSMAYDAARGTVVLFGGAVISALAQGITNDTWTWDGRAWTLRSGSETAVPIPVNISSPVQGGGSSSGSSGSSSGGAPSCSPYPPGMPQDQVLPPGSPAPGFTPPAIPSAPDTLCFSSPAMDVVCFSYSGSSGQAAASGGATAAAAARATPGAQCVKVPAPATPPAGQWSAPSALATPTG